MGSVLLHNAWVQLYLLYVGALGTYFIWNRLYTSRRSKTDSSPARRHLVKARAVAAKRFTAAPLALSSVDSRQSR
jgi:hypothetical protein